MAFKGTFHSLAQFHSFASLIVQHHSFHFAHSFQKAFSYFCLGNSGSTKTVAALAFKDRKTGKGIVHNGKIIIRGKGAHFATV